MYALCVSSAVNTQGFVWKCLCGIYLFIFYSFIYSVIHSVIHHVFTHSFQHPARCFYVFSFCSVFIHYRVYHCISSDTYTCAYYIVITLMCMVLFILQRFSVSKI